MRDRVWLFGSIALLSGACGITFPQEFRIEDLRVLNVVTDPPEISVIEPGTTATTAQQLIEALRDHPNEQEVTLTALLAHPDLDATFNYSWKACTPAFNSLPCEGERRVDLPVEDAEVVRFEPITTLRTLLLESDDPAQALASITTDPRDLLNGLYAHLILRAGVKEASVAVDTLQLDAEKRLVLFDPALVRVTISEARRIGMSGMIPMVDGLQLPTLCTQATAADVEAIEAYLGTRIPNQQPHFMGIAARTRSSTVVEPVVTEGTVVLRRGEQLELRGIHGDADREKYKLIDDNCKLVELQETLSYSWFITAGEISAPITVIGNAERDELERTIYTAPSEIEGTEMRIRIYAILRDGRGGSGHDVLDVVVR